MNSERHNLRPRDRHPLHGLEFNRTLITKKKRKRLVGQYFIVFYSTVEYMSFQSFYLQDGVDETSFKRREVNSCYLIRSLSNVTTD